MDTGFTKTELKDFRKQFDFFDADGSGSIDADELTEVLKAIGMKNVSKSKATALIKKVDLDNNGTVEWNEFLEIVKAERSGSSSEFGSVVNKAAKLHVRQKGAILHTYDEEERMAFADYINSVLENDKDIKKLLPIDPETEDLFPKCADGILLCKLINFAAPKTIDVRAINFPKKGRKLTKFTIQENCTLAVQAAKSIGCNVVNIGAKDVQAAEPHLILGLLWQMIKIALLSQINLKNHPGLVLLLKDGEELSDLLKLPPTEILLRWMNYHLKNAGYAKEVRNFGKDIKDANAYNALFAQIAPNKCKKVNEGTSPKRAEAVLGEADKIGCRKFVRGKDIVSGNKKLNLAFMAHTFNTWPALEVDEPIDLSDLADDPSQTLEARTYTRFLNSLGLDPVINNLFEDLRDGLQLLKAMDLMKPGTVDWKKVEKKTKMIFKKVSNCNLAIGYGKDPFKFSLVGIGGKNIANGDIKPIYALCWQMMRWDSMQLLASLSGGKKVSDKDVLSWSNDALNEDYKTYRLKGWKDDNQANGFFFAALVDSCHPGAIDWDNIEETEEREGQLNNLSYAINRARAKRANVFAVPDAFVADEEGELDKQFRAKQAMLLCAAVLASRG